MVAIPFIYFLALLLHHLRKNKWRIDIASFILVLFAFSGFFSILIDVFELRSFDTQSYKISFTATFVYCGLITLCTIPFMTYSNLKITRIEPIRNSGILKFFAIIFFLYFFINFYFSFDNIVRVVTAEDMVDIRADHYRGFDEETWLSKLPFAARLPFIPLNLISGCSWLFIFLACYCQVIQKMPSTYSIMFFVSSINGIIDNINTGGRSAMIYWLIGAIAGFLFFLPYMNKKYKRRFIGLFTIIASLFAFYLVAMTISRFSDRYAGDISGTNGSLISYMGQSFINFCYFFDTFDCPSPTLQIIFPFTYKLIGYPIQGSVAVQQMLSAMSGKVLGVFYTFIGQIITTTNNFVGILYCVILFVISLAVTRRVKHGVTNLRQAYFYMLCASVLFMGLFGHYYASATKSFSIIFWLILFYIVTPRKTGQNANK